MACKNFKSSVEISTYLEGYRDGIARIMESLNRYNQECGKNKVKDGSIIDSFLDVFRIKNVIPNVNLLGAMADLKPCPFCGCPKIDVSEDRSGDIITYGVSCEHCECTLSGNYSVKGMAEVWNNRCMEKAEPKDKDINITIKSGINNGTEKVLSHIQCKGSEDTVSQMDRSRE